MNDKCFAMVFKTFFWVAVSILFWSCLDQTIDPTGGESIDEHIQLNNKKALACYTPYRLRARSTDGGGIVNLRVDGKTIATFTLGSTMGDYTASSYLEGMIDVQFFNDTDGRDVQIDYLSVDGDWRQAEDQSYNSGVWENSSCGGDYSEWMHCNGIIEFGYTPCSDDSSGSSANEVTRSGSTWTATANGSVVYTGSRMFDAVNASCGAAGNNATISIKNSGDSGEDGGNVYAIRPLAGQTLDFNGVTVNCNSSGDLVVVVHADRRNDITVKNLNVTGNPRYGLWFRGCSNITLTNITMDLSNDSPVGLGIRVDASTGSASNLTINGNVNINGSKGHAIETYSINGVNIGDVTVSNTGGCGVLLNDSENCEVGVVTGWNNCPNGGYATFRVANSNGSTHCTGVYSRNSGRGFFSVSGSHDCTIGWVDIANTYSHGIFLEDATNTRINYGTVSGGNPNIQHVRCSNCVTNVNGQTYTANDGVW